MPAPSTVEHEAQDHGAGPLRVEYLAPSAISPYSGNARMHTQEQIDRVAASIGAFGFNAPVLIDDKSEIIAGHCRTLAAIKLGLAAIPCIRLSHLTGAQRRAYILADNRLAEAATWDDELLNAELADLESAGVDIDLTGFGADFGVNKEETPEPAKPSDVAAESYTVKLTADQFQTFLRAVLAVRTAEGDCDLSEGRALELICLNHLA